MCSLCIGIFSYQMNYHFYEKDGENSIHGLIGLFVFCICGLFSCSLDAYSSLQGGKNRIISLILLAVLEVFLLVSTFKIYGDKHYGTFTFLFGDYSWRSLSMSNLINFELFLGKQLFDTIKHPDKITVISTRPKRKWINVFGRGRR